LLNRTSSAVRADGFVREAGDVAVDLPDFEQNFPTARLERDVIIGQHVAGRNQRAGAPVLGSDDDAVGFRDRIHHADCVELPEVRVQTVDNDAWVGGWRRLCEARTGDERRRERAG